jgi:hypothetical protein
LSKPVAPLSRQRGWIPIGVSAALHALLLALAVGLSRPSAADRLEEPNRSAEEARRIDMIYMPPPPEPTPVKPARPVPRRPPPPVKRTEAEPEPNAPPEAVRSTGDGSSAGESPAQEEPEPESTALDRARPAETEATLESEARRIFGPRLASRPGAGPEAVRPMEAWAPDSERCIPRATEPRDQASPVQLGTVVGRIFRQDNGRPLAGAHLQMMGTPYVTFTDGKGEYRFRFDLALVDNCRTQYVRVSAEGYESRLLVLVVGPHRSEDVLLRRR